MRIERLGACLGFEKKTQQRPSYQKPGFHSLILFLPAKCYCFVMNTMHEKKIGKEKIIYFHYFLLLFTPSPKCP